ncbi:hypothetical protein, partial [Pseudovibrio exalbescens]
KPQTHQDYNASKPTSTVIDRAQTRIISVRRFRANRAVAGSAVALDGAGYSPTIFNPSTRFCKIITTQSKDPEDKTKQT